MNWLEIIEIRTTSKNRDELKLHLQALLRAVNKNKEHDAYIYYKVNLDTDFSIHIHHSQIVEKNGSPLGIGIVSGLKNYGIVDHSVWGKEESIK